MKEPNHLTAAPPWDARLARWMVRPLVHTRIVPNHLTTVRLAVGLAAAAAFVPGAYVWSNIGGLLLVLSNFLDHADGELARISGKTSRFGHLYDLASDAAVTILLFFGIGLGSAEKFTLPWVFPVLGALVGTVIALIFFLRMRIEEIAGKTATRQASFAGFETEDVLYLMPLATLSDGLSTMLLAASVCAPLYAVIAGVEFRKVRHA